MSEHCGGDFSVAAEERAMNALKRGLEVETDTAAAEAAWEWRP
jgi:hypothetical protein